MNCLRELQLKLLEAELRLFAAAENNEKGRWITTEKGQKVFIPEGADVKEEVEKAIEKRIESDDESALERYERKERERQEKYDKKLEKVQKVIDKIQASPGISLSDYDEGNGGRLMNTKYVLFNGKKIAEINMKTGKIEKPKNLDESAQKALAEIGIRYVKPRKKKWTEANQKALEMADKEMNEYAEMKMNAPQYERTKWMQEEIKAWKIKQKLLQRKKEIMDQDKT